MNDSGQLPLAYADTAYAMSLREFGEPQFLSGSGGCLLQRMIKETSLSDAIGPYPLLACRNWGALKGDLDAIGNALVSVVAVADPFGNYDQATLKAAFRDLALPFKQHYVADLSVPLVTYVHPSHLRKARQALRALAVEVVSDPVSLMDEWNDLYHLLKRRHGIRGIAAFSATAFAEQAQIPGAILLRATLNAATVGMIWWYVTEDRAYYHLGAYNETGYSSNASFALFIRSFEHLAASGIRWASLGAGAGLKQSEDGLTRFKRGWTNTTRTSYLCGRIMNAERYRDLSEATDSKGTHFFPAYRLGEHP